MADKLVTIQRRFLWGGGSDHRKIAWVKWRMVCLPKDKGGLGIKDIKTFNTALLAKWRWEMFQQPGEPWARILVSKYSGWRSLEEGKTGGHDSIWWKDIVSTHNLQQNRALMRETEWRLGCGDKCRFWEDCWVDNDVPLKLKYPRLYQISSQQQQTIMQMGSFSGAVWEWQLNWRRPLFDNEIAMADDFIGKIAQQEILPHRPDFWWWKPDPGGKFSSKSAYGLLWGDIMESNQEVVFKELWKLKIPPKASVFAWRLIKDRLPTKLNLNRRQVAVSDTMCPFCRSHEEDAAHLFFNCSKILPLWWESLSWIGILTAPPQNPREHFMQHGQQVVGITKSTRWKCWWVAVTWTIWQQRNRIVFQNQGFNGSKVMDDALLLLWSWLKSNEKDFTVHFNQWTTNLSLGFCT